MKSMKKILLMLVGLMSMPMVAGAYETDIIVDGVRYNINTTTKTASVAGDSYSGDVVIRPSVTYEDDGTVCSVTSIGKYAFDNCEALNSVSIPNSMTTIGDFAFSWCMNINSLRVDIDTPISISDNVFIFYNATLYVPEGSKALYQAAQPWSRFEAIEEYPVKKCATPTISYANGKVRFACETEGVKFVPTAKCLPKQTQNGNELELGGTYDISVVATKEGYRDSQVASKTFDLNQMGDLDGDGEVSVTDVTSLVNVILGK